MIFQDTWQGETVLHEAFIDDNADVSIREVTLGGDPVEDFVSYHPSIGAVSYTHLTLPTILLV